MNDFSRKFDLFSELLKDCSKSSKPHPERATTISRKTNSDFCLNFCAGEAYTKGRDVGQS